MTMTTEVVVITDETPADEKRDLLEARCRRLMAEHQRNRKPRGWDGERDRAASFRRIDEALDAFNAC